MFHTAVIAALILSSNAPVDRDMCGFNSLLTVVTYIDAVPNHGNALESVLPRRKAPFSLQDLEVAAQSIGLKAYSIRWANKAVARFDTPAILHVRSSINAKTPDHFVACFGERPGFVCVVDFPHKPVWVSRVKLCEMWRGDALYITNGDRLGLWYYLQGRPARMLIALAVVAFLWIIVGKYVKRRSMVTAVHQSVHTRAIAIAVLCLLFTALLIYGSYVETSRETLSADLVSLQPIMNVQPGADERVRQIQFTLYNPTSRSVRVDHIVSSCACLAPSWQGKAIGGRRTSVLPVTVNIPSSGGGANRLLIYHDGAGSPLELVVQVQASKQLPMLRRVVNDRPVFSQLASSDEKQSISIETVEEDGSKPWIDRLAASDVELRIAKKTMSERLVENAGFVERNYTFTIGWNRLPKAMEIQSKLFAYTSRGSVDRLFIGLVVASRSRSSFVPSRMRLGPMQQSQKTVAQKGHGWRVGDRVVLPGWLTIAPETVDGREAFTVAARGAPSPDAKQDVMILLQNELSQTEYITVEFANVSE